MVTVAKLKKKDTDDGCLSFQDSIPLGKEYMIDVTTVQMRKGFNFIKNIEWEREMVQDVEGGWIPTELLEW